MAVLDDRMVYVVTDEIRAFPVQVSLFPRKFCLLISYDEWITKILYIRELYSRNYRLKGLTDYRSI